MGTYYENPDEWQRTINNILAGNISLNADGLMIITPGGITADRIKINTVRGVPDAEFVPVPLSEVEVSGVKYPILYKPSGPYIVIELIEDLEYGIVGEGVILKTIPLDVNKAIDTCQTWNQIAKPELVLHQRGGLIDHVHRFETVSDELGMLHCYCVTCGVDAPSTYPESEEGLGAAVLCSMIAIIFLLACVYAVIKIVGIFF
jgi:hypothetical protein